MTTNALNTLLQTCEITGDVLLLDGPHGIGKSERIASWCKDKEYFCRPLFAATQEVGDLIGNTEIVDGCTTWARPTWLDEIYKKAEQGIRSILFLDELNRAQVDVLNAFLELCLNKTMHTHKLPAGTMIVVAINPSNGKYRTTKFDPALVNRFLYTKMEVNVTEWLAWASKNNVNSTILSFISKNEDRLFFEDARSEQSATPRSWTMLSRNIDALTSFCTPSSEVLKTLFVGKLGTAVGGQFYSFYKEYSKNIEPQDVIEFVKTQKIDVSKYQETIMHVAENMKKELIKDAEHIVLLGLVEKLTKSYFNVGITKETLKDNVDKKAVLPLAALLRAIPLEVAAAAIKQLQENRALYEIAVYADVNRDLVTKLATIKLQQQK